MQGDRDNETRQLAGGRTHGRDTEGPGTLRGGPQPNANADEPGAKTGRDVVMESVPLIIVAAWCISALGIGVNFAHTFWEWVPIFAFGGAVPALFLWQANRFLSPQYRSRSQPSATDKEKELLGVLAERGEITPVTAAMRTSLTADEAARMLEELAHKGHLQPRAEDGVVAYALRAPDRRGLPGAASEPPDPESEGGEAPLSLDEDLSERELQVLALMASGRTNSEIAKDLFVAVGTVKTHSNNIYRKLDAKNRAQALARARELNLLP